jgi:hypothetical protein
MIQDLKDLKALFKLCRAQGITELKIQGVEIKLGNLPSEASAIQEDIETDTITDADLLYYSTPQGQAELDKKVGLR